MTPLEQDLLANARDRLRLWAQDTVMRCDAVDLGRQQQVSILFSCAAEILCEMATRLKIPYNEFQDLVRIVYTNEFENYHRKVKEKP